MSLKSIYNSLAINVKNVLGVAGDTTSYPRICDISYAQSDANMNWARIKELNIGIIMRCGQSNFEDALFRTHYKNAVDFGVLFGIYWFFQPNLEYSVQLKTFLNIYNSLPVKPKRIFVDVEPIVYTGVSVFPPSPELHSYWLMNFLSGIESNTGVIPGIYTRQNYWNPWVKRSGTRIVIGGMPYILPQWDHYDLWVASWTNYSANIFMPDDWKSWKIWQFEGGTGRQDGITGPVDLNNFAGTQEEMIAYFGGQETQVMTALYDTNVLQKDRAKVFSYETNTKLATGVAPTDLGIDAVILPMGTMSNYDGSHWVTKVETTFAGRFDLFNNSNIPVMGRFDLNAGSLLKEQHTAPEFEGNPIRENWILPYLLTPWLVGNYDPHNFDWETVLAGRATWRDVKAIILSETEVDGYPAGTEVNDDWQTRLFNYVYNHLKFLMDNQMCPKVPVIVFSGGWWLSKYQNQFANMLANNKNNLYLHMAQWVNYSTATFDNLDAIFAFPPNDNFKFQTMDSAGKVIYTYPDGYFERILMHQFTGQFQKCKQIVDVSGNPVTVDLSLWQSTPDEMKKFFQIEDVTPPVEPPVEPPETDPELEAKIADLESRLKKVEDYLKLIPKFE